jgi:hypothetical protein
MTGDQRVRVVGVTSHDDGLVDRRLIVRGLRPGGQMSLLVHQGGSVKCEVEATRGTDGGIGAACGTGGAAVAVRGAAIGSEVPAIEEG